ncbi:MAG: DNA-binding protein, partial [Thaumarchaeota archaeon]
MNSENKKSDAEDILSEFQKTHGDEPVEEPQVEAEPVEEPQAKAE